MKFLSNIDLSLNQLLNHVWHKIAGDPGAPVSGQGWYDTSLNVFKGQGASTTEIFTRGITVTAPIAKSGTDDKPGISINAATGSLPGSMSAADFAKLAAATSAPTVSTLMMRDAAGRAQVVAPVAASDIARLQDVQDAIGGLAWKDSVRVATLVNGALATAYANGQVVDGVTLVTGDRIWIKNQTTATENGIYTVNASGAPTRAIDADTGTKILQATAFVEEGTQAETIWTISTNAPITLGSTNITVVQQSAGTAYLGGAGMVLSGNTFNVQTANVGRIVVNADDIDLASGVATPGTYDSVTVDTYGRVTGGSNPARPTKFAASVGDGSTTAIAVTHSLGTSDVQVAVYRVGSPFDVVYPDIAITNTNTVTLTFAVAPTTNQYRVVVIG